MVCLGPVAVGGPYIVSFAAGWSSGWLDRWAGLRDVTDACRAAGRWNAEVDAIPGVPAAEAGFVDPQFAPLRPAVAGVFGVGLPGAGSLGACAGRERLPS